MNKEEFGEIYIKFVRDTVLKQTLSIINGESKSSLYFIYVRGISRSNEIKYKKRKKQTLLFGRD